MIIYYLLHRQLYFNVDIPFLSVFLESVYDFLPCCIGKYRFKLKYVLINLEFTWTKVHKEMSLQLNPSSQNDIRIS